MDYDLKAGQRRQIIDESGSPIAEGTTGVSIEDTTVVTLGALDGVLYLRGETVGTSDVTISRAGVSQTHEVTVSNPFDWSLGAVV